jgi:hypothetical protein
MVSAGKSGTLGIRFGMSIDYPPFKILYLMLRHPLCSEALI